MGSMWNVRNEDWKVVGVVAPILGDRVSCIALKILFSLSITFLLTFVFLVRVSRKRSRWGSRRFSAVGLELF